MSERGIIVAFAGQKGGSGKSTVAENIAVALALQGADVVMVDCDVDQRTASKWVSRRNESLENGKKLKQIHITLQTDNIKQGVLDAAKRYDAVVMDVAGRDGRALRTALIVADVIYIPIRPSQNDLETLDHVYEILSDTEDLNPKRTVKTLLTMCPTHALISERTDAEEFLVNFKKLMPLSDASISDRKAYRDASLAGEGVLEGNNEKAKEEIKYLLRELMKYV
jgi:chromosome partitioning protein